MKVAKALKLKNRLAADITRLRGLIQSHNVSIEGHEVTYDVRQIASHTLPATVKRLVTVKTMIACANAGLEISADACENTPYWRVFMIAETKGIIEALRSMPTKSGSYQEFFGGGATTVKYNAALKQAEVDTAIASLEAKIDEMQDWLDCFNASTELAIEIEKV